MFPVSPARGAIRRILIGALALLAATLCAAAPAGAAGTPTWLSPVAVSPPPDTPSGAFPFAFGPGGDSAAAWVENDSSGGTKIVASVRPANGLWSTPVAVSDTTSTNMSPILAVDRDGNVLVVWRNDTSANMQSARYSASDAAWGPVVDISDAGTATHINPAAVGFDSAGDAVVAWEGTAGSDTEILTADLPAGDTAWTSAEDLGATTAQPALAVDAAGDATAVWVNGSNVQSATRPQGLTWGAMETVANDGTVDGAGGPRVALDASGNATAVWNNYFGGWRVRSADRPTGAGSSWSSVATLSTSSDSDRANVAVAPDGTAVAVWGNSVASTVQAVSRPVGGAWSAPSVISPSGQSVNLNLMPGLAADGAGDFATSYMAYDSFYSASFVWVNRLPADGTWDAGQKLSGPGNFFFPATIAFDAGGDALAGWSRAAPGESPGPEAAGFDDAGPIARSITLPDSPAPGVNVPFSADAIDVWSSVDTIDWDFGDPPTGTNNAAQGGTVYHAFSRAGTYTVTVTLTDTLGFTTTETRDVTVAAATSGGGGGGPVAPPPTTPTPDKPAGDSPPPPASPASPGPADLGSPDVGALFQQTLTEATDAVDHTLTEQKSPTTVQELQTSGVPVDVQAAGPGIFKISATSSGSTRGMLRAVTAKAFTFAKGRHVFARAGKAVIRIKATKAGRHVLRTVHGRKLHLTLTALFAPATGPMQVKTTHITLRLPKVHHKHHKHRTHHER